MLIWEKIWVASNWIWKGYMELDQDFIIVLNWTWFGNFDFFSNRIIIDIPTS